MGKLSEEKVAQDEAAATAARAAESLRQQDEEKKRVEDERLKALADFAPSYGFDQRRRGLTSLLGSG